MVGCLDANMQLGKGGRNYMSSSNKKKQSLLAEIQMLILDVDGVLTDGNLYFGAEGETLKVFNVLDGQGIKMLMRHGIGIALISCRASEAVAVRAKQLRIEYVFQGFAHKEEALAMLVEQSGIDASKMAHVGDDIPDLALFEKVMCKFSVPNAHVTVREKADFVTNASGGRGAVREVCDMILAAKQ